MGLFFLSKFNRDAPKAKTKLLVALEIRGCLPNTKTIRFDLTSATHTNKQTAIWKIIALESTA